MAEAVMERSVKEMLEHILDGHHLTEQESARLLKGLTDSIFQYWQFLSVSFQIFFSCG